jgi:hypothetical protein
MTEAKLTIGHVANAAVVNVETVRYYQRRGLVADQEVRAVESQLSLALSSVDVDQLSRLWADDFVSTMDDGHIVSREKRLASLRAQKPLWDRPWQEARQL